MDPRSGSIAPTADQISPSSPPLSPPEVIATNNDHQCQRLIGVETVKITVVINWSRFIGQMHSRMIVVLFTGVDNMHNNYIVC